MRFWPRRRSRTVYCHPGEQLLIGPPMNGQTKRIELVGQIITRCGILRIVETGTFIADTTVWFAGFGLPVMTVEINPRHFEFAQARLAAHNNVVVREGNSIDFLLSIVAGPINRAEPTLFYLDAHWLDHLPLREEIELIVANFPMAVIVIDDFAVPDDAGYEFDDYGPDKRLTLDYLNRATTPPLATYFPRAHSRRETGARRGSVTLTANAELRSILDRLPALRRWASNAHEGLSLKFLFKSLRGRAASL
jgi:hypothetical protein